VIFYFSRVAQNWFEAGLNWKDQCYNSKILEQVNEKNLVLELTQENLIENSI